MKKSVISINITTGKYSSFLARILDLARSEKSSYICVANVHMLVEAQNDNKFATIVNNATMTTPDGMPLVWSMKFLHGLQQDRVAGMDLLPDLLKQSSENNIPVYFYGGTQHMLDATQEYVKSKFPLATIAGMHSPPFRPLTAVEENNIVNKINSSGAKILFVALGCPKQEKWMADMKGKINMPMIGIGGALPVMIGLQSRAPQWAQNAGLEWLYRLVQEPKRLFKRYASTNTIFIWLLLKTKFEQVLNTDRKDLDYRF